VVAFCPHPQMRAAIEHHLLETGCRVRMVTDVASFRATLPLVPQSAPILLVALGRDELLEALLDELAAGGRPVAMIRSARTPRALSEHPRVGATLTIPYDDRQLGDFARQLTGCTREHRKSAAG
jgi:hypothetical protein